MINKTEMPKCEICHKKVGLMIVECPCGKKTCLNCRYPNVHECNRDYASEARKNLIKNNPIVVSDKLVKI